jgi:hypothetical protein
MPFGDATHCQTGGQTTPQSAGPGDLAANVATHEIFEAATDPLLNAWFADDGNETSDLCNFTFGTNTWGSGAGAGNQMWNGFIFEVQRQWDEHARQFANSTSAGCVQAGPQ